MAKKVRFDLNMRGLNELMKSDEMQDALLEAANEVVSHAGPGTEAEFDKIWQGKWVAGARIIAKSEEAKRDNLDNNTLLKAVGSAGLSLNKGG